MAMGRVTKYGLMSAALGAAGIAVFAACGFDPPAKHTGSDSGGGANKCVSTPGTLPPSDCDNSDNMCTGTGCMIGATCGSPGTCLPLSDNAGKPQLDFRLRRLNIAAPATLAATFVQATVVTKGIDLKSKDCGEHGDGAFNWLLRVDRTANKLTTGGAPISADPFGAGYCFYNHITPSGIAVAPIVQDIKFTGDTFSSVAPSPLLNVPIFLGTSIIVLPLSDAKLDNVTISKDSNCIGAFNLAALDSDCSDDPSTCAKWKTAGSLGGYITIEAADLVPVDVLNESLCVLLTQATKDPTTTPPGRCPRVDGKLTQKGDYCSTTKMAGGCQDSFWLAATFAASAVKINDGKTTDTCIPGTSVTDAGPDSAVDASDASGD